MVQEGLKKIQEVHKTSIYCPMELIARGMKGLGADPSAEIVFIVDNYCDF